MIKRFFFKVFTQTNILFVLILSSMSQECRCLPKLLEVTAQFFLTPSKFIFSCQDKPVENECRGGHTPFLTNAFLEQTRNNLENLSDTKVLYMTKCYLKNLSRAKSALRARNLKNFVFGAADFAPPPSHLPHDDEVKPILQMSSKLFEMCSKFFF